jgi:hypothetical protein
MPENLDIFCFEDGVRSGKNRDIAIKMLENIIEREDGKINIKGIFGSLADI